MSLRIALSAFVLTSAAALPALAADPKPCADDNRIECITYRPNEVVHLSAAPGQTLRIQLGDGEHVAGLFVSDQRTIGNEPAEQASATQQMAEGGQNGGKIASCDPNLCRSVVENFVYIMPRRDLTAQPFFLQMQWCDPAGKCQPVPYAFELSTIHTDKPVGREVASNSNIVPADATVSAPAQKPYYGVRFTYPDRDAAEKKREREAKAAAWRAAHPEALRRKASVPVAQVPVNDHYLYRGDASVKPDRVWDDGRSTFIRFNGLRRVPNVYAYLPDGTETNGFGYTSEPDTAGTTLRIGKVAARWCVRDGEHVAGCIFNEGADPEGRYSPTVASTR